MDVDNNMLLERYFSSHNSPYEKTYKVSKHIKFVEPQSFEKDLLGDIKKTFHCVMFWFLYQAS